MQALMTTLDVTWQSFFQGEAQPSNSTEVIVTFH